MNLWLTLLPLTNVLISFALLTGAEHNCSQTFREAFGEIQFSPSNYYHLQCHLSITSGMPDAIAVLSVQEINLRYCSDYVKITDGNGTDVLYHNGCNEQFAPEILFDVHFGLSNNISIRVSASSSSSSIKIEYAILMQSLTSAVIVSGWNISVSNPDSSGATFQWTSLDANVNHQANFYIIEVKSMDGIPLDVHTVPGNTTTSVIKRLEPSTKYRVVVYGVDNNGQPYMSSQGIFTTSKVLCGARPSSTRIVGGTVAAINSWPWQVMLMEHGRQFCGGSLVYPYCVITAAHCVQRKSVPNLKIRVGAHYRTSGSVGTEQDITVSKIIVHENYQIPKTYSNDIALLYLEKPVVLGIGVGLVCLPDIKNILPVDLNETCWITGWGDLYSGGYQPNTLMQASVPLVSKQRCSNVYPGKIDDSMLCAGLDQGGIDTCQGDSGGPLVCEFNGTWHLEGITSWGYGCAQAYKYGVYAKVRALDSWVQANIYKVVPPNTIQPHNQSSVSLISCSFDNGLCSGWRQLSSDDFDWTLGSGSTPSSSTGPSFGQGGSGKYMYIEASSPRKPGEKAQIVVTVPNKGKKACLSFYYHMYGASAGSLNVYSGNDTVFNVSGNQGNRWVIVEKSLHLDSEITFEGVRGGSYTGDIAIDQVLITEGNCPVSCGFDNGLCLWWSQSKSDVFDWRLGSGSTPSSGTGPSSDRSGTGMYMYTEASYQSTGDNAKLELSVPSGKSSSCLTFYYHMYGSSMGTLNVFNGNDKIFAKSGNQGSNWKKVTKTLHLNDVLTFEGIRGTSFTSDIAIDDVQISNGNCPGCGGILNKSSGVVHLANSGNEDETHCIWTIGNAGLRQSYALLSLQRVYLGYCSEHVKVFHEDGTALFDQEGCQSSLPYGTSLEIPFGFSNHIAVDISLQYRWSAVSIQYIISKQGHYSAKPISSWNATVDTITSSSATVRWSNFPLSSSINHYLVRFKEVSGVSILFQVSGYSNSYYTKRLKGYTSYDVTVLAVTASDGNITYSSKNVSMKTAEGVPRRAPSNAYAVNHGLNEFLVEWDPLPHQYANGRLLGYKVYYKDADYYYSAETSVNTSNADESQVALGGVQPGRRYKISVVAFTSKGEGPRSPDLYVTKGCEGSINQVSGWLYFSNSRYNTLNCRVQLQNAGVQSGSALISFQSTYFRYCSEYIKIFDRNGAQVFHRGGCDSLTNGMSVEVPFGDGHSNITLAFLFSYRYSYVRVQYSILNQPLSSAQLVPSWNISISNTTTTSMTVQWSNFPLINHSIQQLLVSCREHDSNVSLIFQTPSSYNAHYTGRVLRSYQYYEVQVIAVASNSSNGTFISRKEIGRTDEGVPSTAPSNVRLTNLQSHEVKVQWDPIPPETANGILLGYRVFYQEYYYSGLLRSVDTKSPSVHMLILRGLKSAQRYQISVAALTSKGAGPRSYLRYFTTGCGGQLKESFGQVLIGSNRNYYYLSCTWNIVNVGIQQAVAFIWIKDFYFSYSSGYLKILDGNGSVLLHQHKYSAIQEKIFLEVEFGSADNITIQTYLRSAYSHFQLYYGTLKRGLQTALLTSNWNVTVENVTSTSVSVLWTNLELLIGDQVLHYISLITSANGSTVLNAVITSGNTTTGNISGLSVYTEYQMSIFGVGSDGQAYKSSNVTFWTEEGVPSGSPSNVRLSNLQHNEIQVQWEPLAQHYVNGRLQGYRVRVYENGYYYYYYYGSPVQTLETPGPYVHTMKVGGLKAAQQYRVTVAAFTSKGEGPQSYWRYITTGCGGSVNQSFGEIQVGRRGYYSSYLRCNWEIGNPGFNQSILIVSFEELYLSSYNEYVKIIDGNGVTVFHHSAYSSSALRTFLLVPYGSGNNVKVQIYFYNSWSQFKLQYGIVNQDLQSAVFVSNWNVTIGNTTQSSIGAQWQNLNEMLNQQILHLVGLVQISSGTTMNAKIMPGNTTFVVFDGLSSYRQYSIAIVGVDDNGKAYKSANITAWTDEGVPSRAPSGVRVTTVEYTTDLLVKWNSLSQIYANGKILGYTIYYREYNNWYSPYKTINTSRPYPTQFVLKGLKPAERYRVAVAAFTSKGRGPMSYYTYGTTSCSQTLREAFGKIQYSPNNYYYLRCHLSITSGGMPDAIAVLSVQEINLRYCSDYVKITDGNGTDVLYHNGCNGKFAPEILFDVQFGLSNNISIQVSASSSSRSIKIEYAVLMQSLTSSFVVSRWNVSVSNPDSSGATLQWTSLDSNVNHQANFYIIEVKSMDGAPLDVHTVPGNTTTSVIKQLKPSTKYRVVVYGVDNNGQPYMSSQSILTTSKVFCGARPSSTRIVGGTDATVNSWPWQVMVTEYGRQFCGGSLVHLYWVITAAHCVQRKSATDIKIRVGAHYRTSASVGTEQDIAVSKIIVHENYQTPKTYSNDIALLYLEKPAVPGVGVGLVCLPDIKNILPVDLNETCWITGWGTLYSGGYQPNTLMQASVPLVSKQRCSNVYSGKIDDSMLCAGLDQGGIDTCQGDSGGPLVCEFNDTWYLEGITSWGYGCAQAYKYGVYAKVRALDSWVQANIYKVVPPNTIQSQNQSSVSLLWCSFDNGLCSGWSQSSSDDFDWTLGSGSTPSSSTGPSSGQGGSGNYLYIEASSPRKPGEKAHMVITVPNKGKKACLSFYYHMYGASAGTLNVYNGNDTVFNMSGNQGNRWVIVEKSLHLDSEITFEGVRGGSYTSDIAIDQVLITEGNCPVSCSFDSGLCLWWSQSKSDSFDWRLGSGSTSSSGTGPSSDRSGTGMYMYTEASYQSRGDNAKLELSVPSGRSSSCLIFYYHMYGSTMGTLNVFNGNEKIFTKSGNQGFYWKKVTKALHLRDVLTFEGIIGTSVTSDIAIDDVKISDGNCPGCGGVLNKSSGVVHLANTGNEDETHCFWTIGNTGLRQSYASLSLQSVSLGYCSEYVKVFHEDGTELFNQGGCQSSLPYGTLLEIPFGVSNHITVDISLQYRWSAVNIQYIISKQRDNSAQPISSWNTTVDTITSSSATVRWSNFPLSSSINHYLVRFKEVSGVSTLFQVSSYSNSYYTNRLKGYTSYDVEVLAVTASDGNITYSSKTVSMKTAEGVPSRAPSNVRTASHGFNEFLVEWDPLPHQYTNGRLLGYKVYYKDADYYYWSEKSVNTSNADKSQVVLGGVQSGRRYKISVVAFTSKGEGPRSPDLYVTKGCEGFVNQVSGSLYFSNSRYGTLNCSVQVQNAGIQHGSALISFQSIYFGYCSEYIKIFDSNGVQVFHRGGCDSLTSGMSVEVPLGDRHSITLAFLFSYRYSYARVQYSIQNQPFSSAQLVPSWNISISNTATKSMTVQWSNFPLTSHSIQQLLVNYREHNSNVSLIFQTRSYYNTHYTGRVLRSYQYYDVQVIAVGSNSSNGTFISRKEIGRTDEGVPSTAPMNVRLTNLQSHEVKVQWDPIPPETANGVLLGYRVFYQEYYYSGLLQSVDTKSPDVHMLVLRGLKSAQRYQISVAAFTSKGAGSRSYLRYITTGCGGQLNQSFGQVHVGSNRNYYYLSCTWNIVNVGMQQAVAFIWISDSYFSYSSGYLKILDGNGSVVLHQHRYSAIQEKIFLKVEFGNANNVTIQAYLASRYSHFQLSYGTLKQGLQSAWLTANWNVTVENVTSTSVSVFWNNLELLTDEQVLHYISLIRSVNGSSVLNAVFTSGNTTSGNISGLSAYTEYQISIVGVESNGQAHNSSKLTFWTEEGVPSRSPSNVRLSNLQHHEIQVRWEPLAQHYVNGRLQGYRVRVYEYGYYYYSFLVQTLETPGPYVHTMKIGGLKAAQQYRVTVAAFTSKGEGPQSYRRYITTGCGGSVNQSFGEIQVGRRGYYSSYLRCNWEIGNSGFNQSILIVSFEDLYISRYSDYVKIIDGSGATVFHHTGYSSSPLKTFLLVQYGRGNSVKVQIYFYNGWSQFKLQYGIINQDLYSALFVSNWNVTIGNTTEKSISVQWQNLKELLNQQILHLFGLLQTSNGTTLKAKIMPADKKFVVFDGLSSYRQYSVVIFGVDNSGKVYKSANITAWTDEGVPSRGPLNITFTNVESTEITVQWDPLQQQYINGRLLGYRVYFQLSAHYYYFALRNNNETVNTTTVTLKGLDPGQRYHISVSAFTSKGEGPRSYYHYVKTACKITLNQSAGLIDVTHTDYNNLHCNWTIGNFGKTNAVALFLFKRLAFVTCSEHVKIFSGSGTLEYYKAGCCPRTQGSLVEIPFMKFDNIAVNILLTQLKSRIASHFVILKHGLHSATYTSGWLASVDSITSSSFQIQWNNLTSLINQEILHYIILLSRTNGSAPYHVLVDGGRLDMEIDGLEHSQMYSMKVYGVDALGYCYKTLEANAATKNASCGSRPSGTRIVGGSIAIVNSWPWQAMLRTSYGSQFCGGTLIHPQWVLTATHCVWRRSASSVKVVLGTHYRSYGNVGTEQSFDVVKIIEHERYNSPNSFSNDIALLQLSKPAKLGKGVGLVCLPDTSFQLPFDNPNKTCWITGWGRLSYLGISPNELMQVDIPLVSKQRCSTSYPGKIDDSMICVGQDQGGIGGCHGDSGGPLVCEFNGKWYLEGATSWGGLPCADPLKYTVYANIRHLKSWITSKMYSLPDPGPTVFNRSCSFDTSLCSGWEQSVSDDFDWTRKRGSTGSWATGPSSDHTSGSGYYMYIEASYPRVMGDKAKLDLSLCGNGDVACLTFYYHMYGSSMGTLNVFSGNTVVFSASGNKGNYWQKAERSIYLDKVLTFEGIVGNSSSGDIAIDDVSISGGNCPGQTLPPRWSPVPTTLKPSTPDDCSDDPEHASICSTVFTYSEICQNNRDWTMKHCQKTCGYCRGISTSTHVMTFKPTTIPPTPSAKEMQEAVMLKMTNFDMNKWKEMEADFKQEVASAATRYCAGGGASCQISLRRRRSSDSMEFSGDMVHIVLGYPKQSPDDPSITLLAFYLQLPGDIGDSLVSEDVLKNIVKNHMKSIEGSMGVSITTVESMSSAQLQNENDEEDKKEDIDNEQSTSNFVIVGVTLGALLLLGIIIAVTWCIKTTRFGPKCRVHPNKKIDEGIDEGREAVYENTKKQEVTFSKPSGIAYDNSAYVSVKQTIAVAQQNEFIPIGDLRDKLYGQQTSKNVRSSAEETSLDEGYREERLSRCSDEMSPVETVNC